MRLRRRLERSRILIGTSRPPMFKKTEGIEIHLQATASGPLRGRLDSRFCVNLSTGHVSPRHRVEEYVPDEVLAFSNHKRSSP